MGERIILEDRGVGGGALGSMLRGLGKGVYIAVGQSSIAPATLPMTMGRLGAAWEPIAVEMVVFCLFGTCGMEGNSGACQGWGSLN